MSGDTQADHVEAAAVQLLPERAHAVRRVGQAMQQYDSCFRCRLSQFEGSIPVMRIGGRVHEAAAGITIDLPTIRIVNARIDLFLQLLKQAAFDFEIVIEGADIRSLLSLEFGVEFRQVPYLEIRPALEHIYVQADERNGAADQTVGNSKREMFHEAANENHSLLKLTLHYDKTVEIRSLFLVAKYTCNDRTGNGCRCAISVRSRIDLATIQISQLHVGTACGGGSLSLRHCQLTRKQPHARRVINRVSPVLVRARS